MADELSKGAALALDTAFRNRITAALMHRARIVIGDETQQPFSRAYAVAVARNPQAFTETTAWVVASDPDIVAVVGTPTDADIIAALLQAWPFLARLI